MENQILKTKSICGIREIMSATGMSMKTIIANIMSGKIHAEQKKKRYVFKIEEKNYLEKIHNEYIGCYRMISEVPSKNEAFSIKIKTCRKDFYEFMNENNWFEIEKLHSPDVFFTETKNEDYFIRKADAKKIRRRITFWISSYKKDPEEKLTLLKNLIRYEYPITFKYVSLFLEKNSGISSIAMCNLLDYLCSKLPCELAKISEKQLTELVTDIDQSLPLNVANLFENLLCFMHERKAIPNGWGYHFNSRYQKGNNPAYSVTDFLKMAYIIFNEKSWKQKNLLQKALSSKSYANLWLFISLHFICGWRATDILRIPLPKLMYDRKTIQKLIENDSFDTEAIVSELEYRLRFMPMKPNKTLSTSGVPDLKLFVPESLRKPIGIILVIAASYHYEKKPGSKFLSKINCILDIENFFGKEFVKVCGDRIFSTRRANKTYLQGIETAGGNRQAKPKGYILAALARSHKGSYGTIPKTTEIYLKDANFSGYSPEFIAKEMFERGVFSFIPAILLEIYDGELYTNLPIIEQTKAIIEIGISASGLEYLAKSLNIALIKARDRVSQIMQNTKDIQGAVADILQAISSGSTVGKQDGMLCLMIAAGFSCPYHERTCCVGCGYEIYTKTILYNLVDEYVRILKKKKKSDEMESIRYGKILKEAIIPAIAEILHSIKVLYPESDLKYLLEVVEGGFRNVDH